MLLGNHEKTIKLFAENFLHGNITFDYGLSEDERQILVGGSSKLDEVFQKWLKAEEIKDVSEEHKKYTQGLYYLLFGWRIRGRIKGVLRDVDLEEENIRLKDDNVRYRLQYEEAKKDAIIALTELRDKNSLLEQYEKASGVKK